MPDLLSWDDADEIAQVLRARFPGLDPGIVSDLEIARWTREIPTLVAPAPAPGPIPGQIEAIREAWSHDWNP